MAGVLAPEISTPAPLPVEPAWEIRDALPGDTAQARELQRAAFDLPPQGWPGHPGHREDLRVLTRSGRVRSCLTLVHATLMVRGAHIPMGGIRHVATHPEEQNQGYASALLRDSLYAMRDRGLPVSVLFPFSFRYYRKFGYELAGSHCQFWCRPSSIPAYTEHHLCRKAVLQDAPQLAEFYRRHAGTATCILARDEARWRSLCNTEGHEIVVCGDPIDGYALLHEDRDNHGGRLLRVLELAASTRTAWNALLGEIARRPAESVEWLTTSGNLAASGLMRSAAPLREGYKPRGIATIRPMFQLRVVDVRAALEACLATAAEGDHRLAIRVQDDLIRENNEPVAISGRTLRPARPTDPSLEADIRIFSQILCGYLSPADAVSQGLARVSSPTALETAELLFPAGEPFISDVDRF